MSRPIFSVPALSRFESVRESTPIINATELFNDDDILSATSFRIDDLVKFQYILYFVISVNVLTKIVEINNYKRTLHGKINYYYL